MQVRARGTSRFNSNFSLRVRTREERPADPAGSVQEHEGRVGHAAAHVPLTGRDHARTSIVLVAQARAVAFLTTLGLRNDRLVALVRHGVLGVLLLALSELVDVVLEPLVELLDILARSEPRPVLRIDALDRADARVVGLRARGPAH